MSRMEELQRLAANGTLLNRAQRHELKRLRHLAGKYQEGSNPLLVELTRYIGQEVDAQLKQKMASQNMELVQEMWDKFRYLIDQYGLPNPTAAEVAEWKAAQKANNMADEVDLLTDGEL